MSTGRQTRGPEREFQNQSQWARSVSRYDLVLALIPVAFLLTAVASGLLGISLLVALAGGSLFGLAVLVDALFLNPPRDGGQTD